MVKRSDVGSSLAGYFGAKVTPNSHATVFTRKAVGYGFNAPHGLLLLVDQQTKGGRLNEMG